MPLPHTGDDVAEKIEKLNASEVIQAQTATLSTRVEAVEAAIIALNRPQAAYERALGARDGLFADWDAALEDLWRKATGVFDKTTCASLFAPPDSIRRRY